MIGIYIDRPLSGLHEYAPMAHIFVIAESQETANAIEQALAQPGHLITIATDFTHIEPACAGLIFDLAVLSLNISTKVKEAIVLQLRDHCENVPVLDMCLPGSCATSADYILTSDSFAALTPAVNSMLAALHQRKTG